LINKEATEQLTKKKVDLENSH